MDLYYNQISTHQTLTTIQCVVIVELWRVSGTVVQPLCQEWIAAEDNIISFS